MNAVSAHLLEFPGRQITRQVADLMGRGFVDRSWHDDAAPCFRFFKYEVFVGADEPGLTKYCFGEHGSSKPIYAGGDWAEVLDAIDAEIPTPISVLLQVFSAVVEWGELASSSRSVCLSLIESACEAANAGYLESSTFRFFDHFLGAHPELEDMSFQKMSGTVISMLQTAQARNLLVELHLGGYLIRPGEME